MTSEPATIHVFEKSGLGKAPYKFLSFETSGDRAAANRQAEANGQIFTTNLCGGTCDYCGQAIFNVYKLRSADGKEFKVGCDCILKTGDKGLVKIAEQKKKETDKANRKARTDEKRAEIAAALADETTAAKLAALPHPHKYFASEGKTLLDYVRYMAGANAGESSIRTAYGVIKTYRS